MVPYTPRFSRRLKVAEDLADLISTPPESLLRSLRDRMYLAGGFMGLLLLWRLKPELRMNFDALMNVSDISLMGPTKTVFVHGHWRKRRDESKPDPDRWKRRKLRKLQQNLQRRNILQRDLARFEDPRFAADPYRILRAVPADGLVCYSGKDMYVERRPSGHIGYVYGLVMPQVTLKQRKVLQESLVCEIDSRVADICSDETARVKAALTRQCERCKLDKTQLDFAAFNDVDSNPAGLSFVCSVFACFSQSRGDSKDTESNTASFRRRAGR